VWAQAPATTNAAANVPQAQVAAKETWLTFGLNRIPWLQIEWMGNPVWQYLAFFLYIVLAFVAAKLLDQFVFGQLKRLAKRTKTTFDDMAIQLTQGPVKIVVFVVLLHVGLEVFAWPAWAQKFISNALKIIVAVSITYVAIKVVDLLMGLWKKRAESGDEKVLDLQLFPIISKSVKIFVVVVAVLVTTQNLGMNITGLLASVSIGGLALGLAAQDTLANLFGAVAIFADKPFRVGDRIQIDSIDGVVEDIGLRSTRVRNLDGHLVTIPNKTMGNATVTNISKRPNIKTIMNIGITYDTPAEKVKRALALVDEVYRQHPMTSDLWISFNKFESASLNILVIHWYNSTEFKAYLGGLQEMNLELKKRFDDEGINFAFPTQTIHLKQDSEWRMVAAGSGVLGATVGG
jgi:MscS family membrane protein